MLFNKSDLSENPEWECVKANLKKIAEKTLTVSVKCDTGSTLRLLTGAVEELFTDEKIKTGEDAILFTARSHAAAVRALEFVSLAYEALLFGHSQDTVSSDIERALMAITDSEAREVNEDIVSDIFSKFCVGK